jgi:hypothetical protein
VFITCLLYQNYIRRPKAAFWYASTLEHTAFFHDMFSRTHFQLVLRFHNQLTESHKSFQADSCIKSFKQITVSENNSVSIMRVLTWLNGYPDYYSSAGQGSWKDKPTGVSWWSPCLALPLSGCLFSVF